MATRTPQLAPVPPTVELSQALGKDLVVTPLWRGPRIVVGFRGIYELALNVDGINALHRPRRQYRRALIFIARRVPALWAALELHSVLVLAQPEPETFRVVDLYDRNAERYLSHDDLLRQTARLDIPPAPFAFVGTPTHEGEARRALQGIDAMGDALEARQEEDGFVVGRVHFRRKN